ncbi:hypothetical protein [Aestuariibaculum sediminum]|uniref:Uncharacterized protein n=1 Tax=Aestuariibaculum sediminum TaxID=2770637 RepID=A0A8J6UFI3_9FLAO|nr:hypothetical protein [Aestuariibaculum sediminum]MBD0831406.1 hypothetical protein [Aestuariibaculum sediminum]
MTKSIFTTILFITTTLIISCNSTSEGEGAVKSLEMSKPDVIVIIFKDGHREHFCPKEKGSSTYTPCPILANN